MRRRFLIPFLMLMAILTMGGGIAAFRLGVVERSAREYLVRRVSAELGAEFDISSVSLSPWFLGFRDVHLKLKGMPLTIEAKRVRIGFNLASLIHHRFNPAYGTERVFLDHPRLVWSLDAPGDSTHKFDLENPPVLPIGKIPHALIDINSGSFFFVRNGAEVEIARNVSGWLDGRNGPAIDVKLEAKVLSSRKNVTCSGLLHRGRESARFDLRAESCDLSRNAIQKIFKDVTIPSGKLGFTLHVTQLGGILSWNGSYRLHDCTIRSGKDGFGIDNLRASGRILREEVTFDTVSGSVFGVYPRVRGRLALGKKARLELTAEADDIDLSTLFTRIAPREKERPRGRANATIGISGALDSLAVYGAVTSGVMEYKGQTISGVSLRMKADSDGLSIEEAGATVAGYRVSGTGTLAGARNDRNKRLLVALFARDERNARGEYRLMLTGNADPHNRNFAANAEFVKIFGPPSIPERAAGTLALRKDDLEFAIESQGIRAAGTIANLFSKPRMESKLTLVRFPVLAYAGVGSSDLLLNGNLELRGNPENMDFSGMVDLSGPRNLKTSVTAKGEAASLFRDSRTIAVQLRVDKLHVLNSLPNAFTVSLRSDPTGTIANITDEKNDAQMSVRAASGTGALTGSLRMRDYPLGNIIGVFVEDHAQYQGKLTGDLILSGTVRDPRFVTSRPIQAEEMSLNGFTNLAGTMSISGKTGELRFTGIDLRRKGKTILIGDGSWISGTPFILSVHGKGAEFAAVNDIISKDRVCDGRVDYEATLAFTLASGTIDGSFVIHDGHFLDIPFDEASARIGGGSSEFVVTDFRVAKKGVYTGTGSATSGYIWKDASGEQGLKLSLDLQGNLLPALPSLTPTIKKANGDCRLSLTLGGSWQEPVIIDGRATVFGATVAPSFIDEVVTGISGEMVIDSRIGTASGLRAARLVSATGMLNGVPISAKNVFESDEMWNTVKRPELVNVVNSVIGLDFGVFIAKIERGRNRERALEVHIPGFMQPRATGKFALTEERGGWFVAGASPGDDHLVPYLGGTIRVLSGDITFPLLEDKDAAPGDSSALGNIYWDMEISAGSSVYYVHEISKMIEETRLNLPFLNINIPLAGATLARASAKLDEKSVFTVTGRFGDGSYRVTGDARSTEGSVSYVGVEFDIEAIELDLDTGRTVKPVVLTARAKTTVTDDSTGIETDVYLKVNAVDNTSGNRREATGRTDALKGGLAGSSSELSWPVDATKYGLGFFEIQFVSTNPSDNNREKVLARLGISPENVGDAATRALAQGMDEYYLNFMRPIEQIIRKYTGLDVVRFTPMVIGNLVRSKLVVLNRFGPDTDYMMFDGSYVMVGEYFMDGFFLSYRGQYGLARDFLQRKQRGFYHEMSLQYPLKRNTHLQFNFDYDNVIRQSDKRIEIRHDFEF